MITPWCTDADLTEAAASRVGAGDAAPPDVVAAIAGASQVLFALTGRRWNGGGHTATVEITPGRSASTPFDRRTIARMGPQAGPAPLQGLPFPCGPVTAVTTLLDYNGAPVDQALWRLQDDSLVQLADGEPTWWTLGRVTATFTWGAPPPQAGVRVAGIYASELILAVAGDKACRLPARVQSITRQNVTIAITDSDFLDGGRTGVTDVDTWIRAVNPSRQLAPARVVSPDTNRVQYRTLPTGA